MNSNSKIRVGDVELDGLSIFLATYLSWARQIRVYATRMPLIAYRGHACETWKLLPSLCRESQKNTQILRQIEEEVIREFRGHFKFSDYLDMEVLAYARHHAAPTRLLDWSSNPFVGLWFAVSDKNYDSFPGTVFQLFPGDSNLIGAHIGDMTLDHVESCTCPWCVHILSSPPKIERTQRQQSIFTIARFKDDCAIKPLDEIGNPQKKMPIRKFLVPQNLKPELRRTLAELGLDAFGIYGGPDALGKTLSTLFDLSDLKVSDEIVPHSKS